MAGADIATDRPAPAFGQVWASGKRVALVRSVAELHAEPGRRVAHMTEIVNGRADGARLVAGVVDGVVMLGGPWAWLYSLPRLVCLDPASAAAAAAYLEQEGMRDVLVDGDQVAIMLEPRSVLDFAEDALEHGWATDQECGRMIGRLR